MQSPASSPPISAPLMRSVSLCTVSPRLVKATKKQVVTRGAQAGPVEQRVRRVGGHHGDRRLQCKAHVSAIAPCIRNEETRGRALLLRVAPRVPIREAGLEPAQRTEDRDDDGAFTWLEPQQQVIAKCRRRRLP